MSGAQVTTSERRPSLNEFAARAINAWMRGVFRARPGVVKKWDASKQKADVQPTIQIPYRDEEDQRQVRSDVVLTGVPVIFAGAGPCRFTFPISDGKLQINGDAIRATTGLIIWCDCSLDKWLSGDGREVDPQFDHRDMHNDAIFLPGFNPFGAALGDVPTDHMSIGFDEGLQVKIKHDVVEVGVKDALQLQFVSLANKVDQNYQDLKAQLDAIAAATHTHSAPLGGTGPSTINYSNTYSVTDTAAKNLKAEE